MSLPQITIPTEKAQQVRPFGMASTRLALHAKPKAAVAAPSRGLNRTVWKLCAANPTQRGATQCQTPGGLSPCPCCSSLQPAPSSHLRLSCAIGTTPARPDSQQDQNPSNSGTPLVKTGQHASSTQHTTAGRLTSWCMRCARVRTSTARTAGSGAYQYPPASGILIVLRLNASLPPGMTPSHLLANPRLRRLGA